MSDNKRDSDLFSATSMAVVKSETTTGSMKQETPKVEATLKKQVEKLTIPIESYAGYMSPKQLKSYQSYQRSQFPDLFKTKGLEDDKASEVPFLALTMPTRLFADLLEATIRENEKDEIDKVKH